MIISMLIDINHTSINNNNNNNDANNNYESIMPSQQSQAPGRPAGRPPGSGWAH